MFRSASQVLGYHAHIYCDASTAPFAESLRQALAASFPVEIGKLIDGEVGPHPTFQIPVMFRTEAFQQVVPWLMLNRGDLNILIHPLTDDEHADHTGNALWLGHPVPLKLDVLRHAGYAADLLPTPG